MMHIFLISDLMWNRIITVGCFSVVLSMMMLKSRSKNRVQRWRSMFGKDAITEFDKISKIIHSAPFALNTYIVLNSQDKIVGANERTQKMFGWTETELTGCGIPKIIAAEDVTKFFDYKKEHKNDERTIELNGITKTGEKLTLEVFAGRWTDDVSWYYTVIIRDISHRKRNEAAVTKAYEELNFLRELYHEGEKIGNVAFWKLDVRTGKLYPMSPNFSDLFGVNGQELKVESLIKRVFEDDKKLVALAMNRAKELKTGYDIEYRMHGWDDYINTIHSTASAYKNKKGELTHYIGMARLVKKEKAKWA